MSAVATGSRHLVRLTENYHRRHEALARREAGVRVVDLAAEYGVSSQQVYYMLRLAKTERAHEQKVAV